jgi:preprotein translocase subunit YajC
MQPTAQPNLFESLLPIIVIFAVFYFLIIRPQSKKQKDHLGFLNTLKRGDEVVTASGILGTVDGLTDLYVTLEVASNVKIKVLRSQIASLAKNLNPSTTEKKG